MIDLTAVPDLLTTTPPATPRVATVAAVAPKATQPVSTGKVPTIRYAANDAGNSLVPRDLVVRVGRFAGFAIYYDEGVPKYKERCNVMGENREAEVEFVLPNVAMRIMTRAPHLAVKRDGSSYLCALSPGQEPERGSSLIEAVFRAFAAAKSQVKAA